MTDQDRILQFLISSGPTIPSKVAKLLNTQILLASAHLSDLSAQGKVKVSHLKIGGTPLYYLPGQEDQLLRFAQNNLNPKDYQVLLRLEAQKILREKDIDLLTKVALRSLRDFSVPLQVTIEGKTELFWKWHLLPEQETSNRIQEKIAASPESASVPAPPSVDALHHQPLAASLPAATLSSATQNRLLMEGAFNPAAPTDTISPLSNHSYLAVPSKTVPPAPEPAMTISSQQKLVPAENTAHAKNSTAPVSPEQRIPEKKILKKREKNTVDEFSAEIDQFLRHLKISIEQRETIRKNAELDLLLKVPSVVGTITYFCKAKNKIKCDEKDISAAYMEAQVKKLPLLFIYTEELSKKAREMLESGAFENAVVLKLK